MDSCVPEGMFFPHRMNPTSNMPQYLADYLTDYHMRVQHERDVNSKLRSYGAKTFGSLKRREERLRRFEELDARRQMARVRLEEVRRTVQAENAARAAARADEILAMVQENDCFGRLLKSIQNGFVRITRG